MSTPIKLTRATDYPEMQHFHQEFPLFYLHIKKPTSTSLNQPSPPSSHPDQSLYSEVYALATVANMIACSNPPGICEDPEYPLHWEWSPYLHCTRFSLHQLYFSHEFFSSWPGLGHYCKRRHTHCSCNTRACNGSNPKADAF